MPLDRTHDCPSRDSSTAPLDRRIAALRLGESAYISQAVPADAGDRLRAVKAAQEDLQGRISACIRHLVLTAPERRFDVHWLDAQDATGKEPPPGGDGGGHARDVTAARHGLGRGSRV